jgi:hypothetical protein
VWYSFVAQSAFPLINLSAIGANLQSNGRIQLLTGTCAGTLIPVGTCHSIPAAVTTVLNTVTNPGGIGLTIGQTYFIRITHNTLVAPVAAGTYTFNICVTDPVAVANTIIDYSKSYVNLTDGTVGGTINPGDVLEIRATLVVRGGAAKTIDSVAYYDTLLAGRGLSLNPGTIATRTNEGKLFQSFTDASADVDAGWYTTAGAGTDTAIQINIGAGATRTARGKLIGTSKPSLFGTTCIIMATYHVTVNAGYGTKINFGGGSFVYKDAGTGAGIKIDFPNDSLMVFESVGICPNGVAQTNILGDEFNGTFGAPAVSAGSQNRGTSPNTSYTYQAFNPAGPNDYFYGVPNNSSANNSIVQTVAKPGGAPRVFGHWDITGDHTGAANPAKGNKPCNPALPISATNPCGYMLVVNAAYRTDLAFTFTVSGACPNTYYEISAWVKNICYKCGCDVNGIASTAGGYIPTAVGDSSGVRPNLAFEVNGIDYYTTGDIPYQGLGGTQTGSDTLNKWLQKSFIYRTGISETGFVLTIRNNAPGGGGNDWALDDISLRTCYPNMSYSPSSSPSVCVNNTLVITDTVRSYYNTYVEYKWQRSTDGGSSWVDVPGTVATATPVVVNGMYQFITSYTVPAIFTTIANSGNLYRVVVATTSPNLASTCNYSDATPITLTVLNSCKDIDDDNDGIPDYVEFNNPVALQDVNGNGIPNWNDPTYPGYVDNNADGVNDNFDYGADSNNDGIPNYLDPTFLPFIDTNGDGVNDWSDKDLDGIPNQFDLDSDNDGIPDVVESYGVDENGDGVIDNYSDTDNDGFSQNVDANNTGVGGSNVGLGAQDLDGDGIPNYLDLDSDNDGIPDVIEAGGTDANNDGKEDGYTDMDSDGFSDNVDGDVGNNLIAENASNSLLRTGPDTAPVNGRADNYPYKNFDNDKRANPYDIDSDMDGIVDVIEAGFADTDYNGFVDGPVGADGWNIAINALPSLNLLNSDGVGNPNYLDIDSDGDGIPDNIEGQTTLGYKFPTYLDNDNDGLDNAYDLAPFAATFGGAGIALADKDGDGIPDYIDLDTDSDGVPDIVEGNDFNLNGIADDIVTPTGLDTDGDGLDNRFDSLNSVTNLRGTSYMMGTGGSLVGDPTPGTKSPVQKFTPAQPERDWRYVTYLLPLQYLQFTGAENQNNVTLSWSIISSLPLDVFEIERSIDNVHYQKIGTQSADMPLDVMRNFSGNDNIDNINSNLFYYRLKVIAKNRQVKYSNVVQILKSNTKKWVNIHPNPASNEAFLNFYSDSESEVIISVKDNLGKVLFTQKLKARKGNNSFPMTGLSYYRDGVYSVQLLMNKEVFTVRLIIQN